MKTLNTILGYLPYVLAGVVAVEQTVGAAKGTDKKTIVLSSVTAAAKVGEQVPEAHVQAISALIDSIVASLNASGIFGHGPTAAATVVAATTPVTPAA